jgi:serine/threonine protein kinase
MAHRVESIENDGAYFLPLDYLDQIITEANIKRELSNYGLLKRGQDLSFIARKVIKIDAREEHSRRWTCRRKIFAVLALMKKSDAIIEVINEGLYDDDLPFNFKFNGQNHTVSRQQRGDEKHKSVDFLKDWDAQLQELFDKYQWQMTAPYFKLSWEPGRKICHYALAPQALIPFVEETAEVTGLGLERSLDFSGGTSTVKKVKIHKAHYNCLGKVSTLIIVPTRRFLRASKNAPADENMYFAVKKLKMSDKMAKSKGQELHKEVKNLKRFADIKNNHLIRLLAAYTHKGHLHMIFPYAEGNLLYFWEEKDVPNKLARDWTLARWVSRQFLGLAEALQCIHLSRVDSSNTQNLDPNFRHKKHGRHGDLKPENILFFPAPQTDAGDEPIGVLKISDFGFADFHKTASLDVKSNAAIGGLTPTYRAPEFDTTHKVSPAYDIWGFGCVLLEFVVWYLRGWQGVEMFSRKRAADSTANVPEDNFFNLGPTKDGAKPKESVLTVSVSPHKRSGYLSFRKEMNELRQHPACSDFTVDLLDFIQSDMLRLDPRLRATCGEIVEKLKAIVKDCEQDKYYCLARRKELQPVRTDSEPVKYRTPKGPPDPINIVEVASSGNSPAISAHAPTSAQPGGGFHLERPTRTPVTSSANFQAQNEAKASEPEVSTHASGFRRAFRKVRAVFSDCFGLKWQ